MADRDSIADNVKAARERAGLDRLDVAARINAIVEGDAYDEAWVAQIEQGDARVGSLALAHLAEAIGTDVQVLLGNAEHDPLTDDHRQMLERAVEVGDGVDAEVARRCLGSIERLEWICGLKHDAMRDAHRRLNDLEDAITKMGPDVRRAVAEAAGLPAHTFENPLL